MKSDSNEYFKSIMSKFSIGYIKNVLNNVENLRVLVIGDIILDHYVFVSLKGRAIKDPILSTEFNNREIYAGGILAIANHLSNFVEEVKVVSLIGDQNPMVDFINQSVNKNIRLKTFIKVNSPTTVKKRIIDDYRNNKLFKIEYINDRPISDVLTQEIVTYLNEELPKYNLVIVGDFGHGFINDGIKRKLEEKARFLSINAQSNSANMGYNYFNLYKKINFICMNEEELRLPLSRRFEKIDTIKKEAHLDFNLKNFLVTHGKNGCTFVNEGISFEAPVITKSITDTVGAGDALFVLASLLVYQKADNELIPFIANCAGGIAANIMGNKESVTKEKLLSFINEVYDDGMGRI